MAGMMPKYREGAFVLVGAYLALGGLAALLGGNLTLNMPPGGALTGWVLGGQALLA